MSSEVVIEVPEADVSDGQHVGDLAEGVVFQHDDGFGVKLYDGAIAFKSESGVCDGDEVCVYSEEELDTTSDLSGARAREDLRLKIVLEVI